MSESGALNPILRLMSALGVDGDVAFRRVIDRNWQRPARYNTVCGG